MILKNLDDLVLDSQSVARTHSMHCKELIDADQLSKAIEYCRDRGIDPPQCSLTASSVNADKLRTTAKGMLSDEAWWTKRLKTKTLRDYENRHIKSGNVTNIISDKMVEYMKKR